jgi:pimeloyl-ACP methyl ester carboxylesterase
MIDSSRRTVLATGAAAAAASAAPQVFAQAQPAGAVPGLPAGAKVGSYEKGNVRIRYAEIGSGFPLLATPGGGLNSCIAVWSRAVINIPEEFKNDFRVITMDQRNATGGESIGPVPVDDPWGAFAGDQLGVMDHLGISRFFFFGNCIGGPFRDEADGARAAARRRGYLEPAGRAQPGETGLHVRCRQDRLGQGAARAQARRVDGDHRKNICTTFTACGPTSCTACRASSRNRARRRCWCCPTMSWRIRWWRRSTSPRSARMPRSRCSPGRSRRS